MYAKPLHLILVTLVVMTARSGCGNSGKQEPRAHHPSEKEWKSLTDTGQTLILSMGDQRFRLLEPHFEGDVFVANLGASAIRTSFVRSGSKDSTTTDSTDAPILEVLTKQVYLHPSSVVRIRDSELRMTREELTEIQTYDPQQESKALDGSGILFLLVLALALKLASIFIK